MVQNERRLLQLGWFTVRSTYLTAFCNAMRFLQHSIGTSDVFSALRAAFFITDY